MGNTTTTNYLLLLGVGIAAASILADSLEGIIRLVVQLVGIATIIFAVYKLSPIVAKGGKK